MLTPGTDNSGDADRCDVAFAAVERLPSRRSWLRALVQDFSPIWYDYSTVGTDHCSDVNRFTWCMNSGIIAILMHQYSYQFPGLQILATIAYMTDFTLFIWFSLIMIMRLIWFRKTAPAEILDNRMDLPLLACWPIAWMTIVSFVALTVSEASWGGHAFTIVAYVMWWFGAAWTISIVFLVIITVIIRHKLTDHEDHPVIVIPAVAVTTVATIGGLITSFTFDVSAGLSVPIIICSFWIVGLGILLATLLYSFLLHRLFSKGLPSAPETASIFILVGPMSQSAAALQVLGSAAQLHHRFAGYDRGAFLTETAALPLQVACILLGMLLSGMALFWLILACFAMFYRLLRKELDWTPSWTAIIYPTGTFAVCTLQFAKDMDSSFFKVITGIIIVFLVIIFFVNLVLTAREILQGRLLIVREDPRTSERFEVERKAE